VAYRRVIFEAEVSRRLEGCEVDAVERKLERGRAGRTVVIRHGRHDAHEGRGREVCHDAEAARARAHLQQRRRRVSVLPGVHGVQQEASTGGVRRQYSCSRVVVKGQ